METLLAGLAIWGVTVMFGVQARKAQVKAEELKEAEKPDVQVKAEEAPTGVEPSVFMPTDTVTVPEKPMVAEEAPDIPLMLSGKRMSRKR